MTITREYINRLHLILLELCSIDFNKSKTYIDLKISLVILINEINHYKLFELNLNESDTDIISNLEFKDIQSDLFVTLEALIPNFKNLFLGKLWYGGELMYHFDKIYYSLLNINDIKIREKILTTLNFPIKEINKEEFKNKLDNEEAEINSKYKLLSSSSYLKLSKSLKMKIEEYENFVSSNYPSIKHYFTFYNKDIRAYICDERENLFVCLINIYDSNIKSDFNLSQVVYDICPRPDSNFEKIEKELFYWSWFGVEKTDLNIENFLDKESIYLELIDTYIILTKQKKEFLFFILKIFLNKIITLKENVYKSINKEYVFSVIYDSYDLNLKLNKAKEYIIQFSEDKILYTFFKIDNSIIEDFAKAGVKVIDINSLIYELNLTNSLEIVHYYIKDNLQNERLKLLQSESLKLKKNYSYEFFKKQLEIIKPGKNDWNKFENFCIDAIKFILEEEFSPFIYEPQSKTEDGILRRDFIIHNSFKNSPSFFSRIYDRYNAKTIIFEFKNYSEEISFDTFFSTTKYLNDNNTNVLVIFTRKGIRENIKAKQIEFIKLNKLVICFDEEELLEMIKEKNNFQSNNYRFEIKMFDLLKKY